MQNNGSGQLLTEKVDIFKCHYLYNVSSLLRVV